MDRRSIILRGCVALLGFYCVLRGVAYLPPFAKSEGLPSGLNIASDWLPLSFWAGVWLIIGFLCFAKLFTKNTGLAVPLATGMTVTWGVFYLVGWIVDLFYGIESRSWLSASSYLIPGIVMGALFSLVGDTDE